ncbi:hypothetical protein BT67DRAFT_436230 [Trichocladium antarcticum]|uniref:Uncharacterized protein n=1 Tax=Trichocladium antarcticum TaxID=1450529 RepID=A0AAN6UEL0_9PEZI|nr:hypothetical protein BT67DRAFT_436230 [Trichocladium antarcticum]
MFMYTIRRHPTLGKRSWDGHQGHFCSVRPFSTENCFEVVRSSYLSSSLIHLATRLEPDLSSLYRARNARYAYRGNYKKFSDFLVTVKNSRFNLDLLELLRFSDC